MCCDTVNRGVAYADGKIFLHQADTTLVALDAKTGEVVWSVKNGDPKKGETNTARRWWSRTRSSSASRAASSACAGRVTAYNIKDGKQVWRAYSTARTTTCWSTRRRPPSSASRSARTLGPRPGRATSGRSAAAPPGAGMSYDPDLNLVYYGSGNPSTWNPVQRPGDNKWSMTIFARNPDTGMAKWVYQMTPHDEWDFDGVNEMVLADVNVDGTDRKLLVHFDRNGFGYTLDRETGELLVAEKYDPAVNWATGVDMDDRAGRRWCRSYSTEHNGEDVNTTGICPAALGTKDQQPAAYSPKTGLFYVPTNHVCMDYEPFQVALHRRPALRRRDARDVPGAGRHGSMGNFIAWDAAHGQDRVVDAGAVLGLVGRARDRRRRRLLRHARGLPEGGRRQDRQGALQVQDPVRGSSATSTPTTHNGKQYVGVLSGVGGWAGHRPRGRPDRATTDGPRRGRRLQGAVELHPARRRS